MVRLRLLEPPTNADDPVAEVVAITNAVIDGRPEIAVSDVARAEPVVAIVEALLAAERAEANRVAEG